MEKLTAEQGKFLLKLARSAIEAHLSHKCFETPPHDALLDSKRGVFCTLKTGPDVLRGCIGFPLPNYPLAQALADASVSAAVRDPRFKPVELSELLNIKIEITVLTPPKEVDKATLPDAIKIGTHGLIAKHGAQSGLLLPQVAVDDVHMSSIEFLEATCWKAGLPTSAWKEKDCTISTFEGQIFKEQSP